MNETWKHYAKQKKDRYKKVHIVWFHLCKISRITKSVDTDCRLVELSIGKWGTMLNGCGIFFWSVETVSELERSDCTTLWKCKMPSDCSL